MEERKKISVDDLLAINDYSSSLELGLRDLGIRIEYTLEDARFVGTYVNSVINFPSLRESKLFTLFLCSLGMVRATFTKKDNEYVVFQTFGIGSTYNNPFFLKRILEIEEGDEWKMQQYEWGIIPFEKVLDISRRLTGVLTNDVFKEFDERSVSEKWVKYRPFPSLAHRFDVFPGMSEKVYTGSEITLEDETVEDLSKCSLKNNLVVFNRFFQNLI